MKNVTLAALLCTYFTFAVVLWAWLLENDVYNSFYVWILVQFVLLPRFSQVPFHLVFVVVALYAAVAKNCVSEKTLADLLLPFAAFGLSAFSCTRLFLRAYDAYIRLTTVGIFLLIIRSACISSAFFFVKAGLFCAYTCLSAYVYNGQAMYFLRSNTADYQCTYEQACTNVGTALYKSRVEKKKLAFSERTPPFGTCTIVERIRKRLQWSHIVHSAWVLAANWFDNYIFVVFFVAANLCMLAVHNRVFQLWVGKRKRKKKNTENV